MYTITTIDLVYGVDETCLMKIRLVITYLNRRRMAPYGTRGDHTSMKLAE
jgi:hypothetical protein